MPHFKDTRERVSESFFGGLARAVESIPGSVRQSREDERKRKLVTFEALQGMERDRLRREQFNQGMERLKLDFLKTKFQQVESTGRLRIAEERLGIEQEELSLKQEIQRGKLGVSERGVTVKEQAEERHRTEAELDELIRKGLLSEQQKRTIIQQQNADTKIEARKKFLPFMVRARLNINDQVVTIKQDIKTSEKESNRLIDQLTERIKEDKTFFEGVGDFLGGDSSADKLRKFTEKGSEEQLAIPQKGISTEARDILERINSARSGVASSREEINELQLESTITSRANDLRNTAEAYDDDNFTSAVLEIQDSPQFKDGSQVMTLAGLELYLEKNPDLAKYKKAFIGALGIR